VVQWAWVVMAELRWDPANLDAEAVNLRLGRRQPHSADRGARLAGETEHLSLLLKHVWRFLPPYIHHAPRPHQQRQDKVSSSHFCPGYRIRDIRSCNCSSALLSNSFLTVGNMFEPPCPPNVATMISVLKLSDVRRVRCQPLVYFDNPL
jgi:hypothetical protein